MRRGLLWLCFVLAVAVFAAGCNKDPEPKQPLKMDPKSRLPKKPGPADS
jgi:hypothetical protein